MNQYIEPHNLHWEAADEFAKLDPQLRRLSKQPYQYHSCVITELPRDIPGIYTVGGGRQVGKSTLMKQWMLALLEGGVEPRNIFYLSGEVIDDHHQLIDLVQRLLSEMPKDQMHYIIIDEVTYIGGWDKGVKYLSDGGLLDKTELVLTGSDLVIMQEARMTFPGRRGIADKVDFYVYPLSFYETVHLKGCVDGLQELLINQELPDEIVMQQIMEAFNAYLSHGGYLVAINDIAKHQKILPATMQIYCEWVRGDIIKRHKQEHNLREIMSVILRSYGSQVTWTSLAQGMSIEHPKTIADYMALLQSMDAIYIQQAILEDKLVAAPKKAKKVLFSDPFIFHALNFWINKKENPYESLILASVQDSIKASVLVETTVVNHVRRYYPTYYIKAAGEVDIAYVNDETFWPVEIKWTQQLRTKDLKQTMKYKNSEIWTKSLIERKLEHVPVYNLLLVLLRRFR